MLIIPKKRSETQIKNHQRNNAITPLTPPIPSTIVPRRDDGESNKLDRRSRSHVVDKDLYYSNRKCVIAYLEFRETVVTVETKT